MYALLRAIAGVALRWYYRDIQVEGFERIPRHRPLLLVVNHPNALVDALLVGWVMPRRVLITAKSTLFANPLANVLLRVLGVLPLRRTSDESRAGQQPDPARNRDTFRAVHEALRGGRRRVDFSRREIARRAIARAAEDRRGANRDAGARRRRRQPASRSGHRCPLVSRSSGRTHRVRAFSCRSASRFWSTPGSNRPTRRRPTRSRRRSTHASAR